MKNMNIIEDRYAGVVVDQTSLPETSDELRIELKQLLNYMNDKKLVWLKLPIEKSDFIPILTGFGFVFHHCDESNLMLVKKISKSAVLPTAQNYTVGVGAVVMDGSNLLVIRDRFSKGYKLPGGHVDNNESIKEALKREVHEETGVVAEFESIVNIGHFMKGQFGESNLYIVCVAKLKSKNINIQDTDEILEAKWMDIEAFLSHKETNAYNRSVVEATIGGSNYRKLIEQPIQLKVSGEVFY
ncbi:MAG: NUDIX domain-containing protein [Asgard group archaeon]|nr:NUDIX domain-containing protein [Asgard group archaeon]